MRKDPAGWSLYVATSADLGWSHLDGATEAIRGGARVVQLRDKRAPGGELLAVARSLRALTQRTGVPLIVNDRVDVALAAGADGVHVGQSDLPALEARRLIGPERILGVSATSVAEAVEAEARGADYIGFGPVFDARATKPDADEPTGLEQLAEACDRCGVPIIAIGGIGPHNAAAVMRAGAAGVAVISAVVGQADPAAAARRLVEVLEAARR